MRLSDFRTGREFWMGGRRWRCTDVGTRVAVAICLEDPVQVVEVVDGVRSKRAVSDAERPAWHRGPPYAIEEVVIDECDMQGCRPSEAAWKEDFE